MKEILTHTVLVTALACLSGTATAQNTFNDTFNEAGSKFSGSLSARDSIPPVVVQFSPAERGKVEMLEADMSVMTRLIEKSLERGLGEEAVQYKMNVPLLVTSSGRSVRAMYAEGLGALFMIKLNMPLVGPPRTETKKLEGASDSEWDRIRKEMEGEEEAAALAGGSANSDFEEGQVEGLKTLLLKTLKHASNIRRLLPDEFVAISVFGSDAVGGSAATTSGSTKSSRRKASQSTSAVASEPAAIKDSPNSVTVIPQPNASLIAPNATTPPASPGKGPAEQGNYGSWRDSYLESGRRGYPRGTVLTLRVKKADVDLFAKGGLDLDGFRKRATINAYNGNGYGVTSLNSWIQTGRAKTAR